MRLLSYVHDCLNCIIFVSEFPCIRLVDTAQNFTQLIPRRNHTLFNKYVINHQSEMKFKYQSYYRTVYENNKNL